MKTLLEYIAETDESFVFDTDDKFYEDYGFITETTLVERGVDLTQPWPSEVPGTAPSDRERSAEKIYAIALQHAKSGYKELNRKLQHVARGAKVVIKIKPEESFVNKVSRGKNPALIKDVLRSAVMAKTDEEVKLIVQGIKKKFKIGREEFKKKGSDPEYGYHGSYHFIVDIGGMWAEIQVMTSKLWAHKKAAHKIYKKYRSNPTSDQANSEHERLDKNLSKHLMSKGNVQVDRKSKKAYTRLAKHKRIEQ